MFGAPSAALVAVALSFLCFSADVTGNVTRNEAPFANNSASTGNWSEWLVDFGRDKWQFPQWLVDEMNECNCKLVDTTYQCKDKSQTRVQLPPMTSSGIVPFCAGKEWSLNHMPEFDLHFLPPSVSILGKSMLDDNVGFAVMAFMSTTWSSKLPVAAKLSYILPYASFHEARTNWRPLLFAKYFPIVATAKSTAEAMTKLITPFWSPKQPPTYLNWTGASWDGYPGNFDDESFAAKWATSTTPPVIAPMDFVGYGYGSCTAFASMLVYVARAAGIPARIAGTPCWNLGEFQGLASSNPNVTHCWHGHEGATLGGLFLNNHNWVEYWDDATQDWVFVNVPPGTAVPNEGLCNTFSPTHGCGYNSTTGCKTAYGPGLASQDHEIFVPTWTLPGEETPLDGGPVIDIADLKLSNGEEVSSLVWSPYLQSPSGEPLKNVGLRVVNRTDYYRCKEDSETI